MFINQPRSSSGGAAESQRGSGCLLPDQTTSGTDGPWLSRHVQALRHVQQARRQRWLNHPRHLRGARRAASALENALFLLEEVAQPLRPATTGCQAGGIPRDTPAWGRTSSIPSAYAGWEESGKQHQEPPQSTHLRAPHAPGPMLSPFLIGHTMPKELGQSSCS